MAMAIWGLGIMVAPIVGPTVGGWITENYSWRWIFYLNLPVRRARPGPRQRVPGGLRRERSRRPRPADGPVRRRRPRAPRGGHRRRSRSRWTRASGSTGSTRPRSRRWSSWPSSRSPRFVVVGAARRPPARRPPRPRESHLRARHLPHHGRRLRALLELPPPHVLRGAPPPLRRAHRRLGAGAGRHRIAHLAGDRRPPGRPHRPPVARLDRDGDHRLLALPHGHR